MDTVLRTITFRTPVTLPIYGNLNYPVESVVLDANGEHYDENEHAVQFATTDVDDNARFGLVAVPMSNIVCILSFEVEVDQ